MEEDYLMDPPEGYKYHPNYLKAWDINHDPNSILKICYDGPIFIPSEETILTGISKMLEII